MSGLANPRKNFRWALEIDGANQFLMQEVTVPEVELQEQLHGAPANIPDAKTPGKMIVGDLEVKKLKPALTGDQWAWNWLAEAYTGVADAFKKTGFLLDLGPDGASTVERYFIGNMWPKKISDDPRVATSENADNLIQTVTFSVQMFFPEDSTLLQTLLAGSAAAAGGIAFANGFLE